MSQEKDGSAPRRNCLNIFFPQQVESTKAKSKHYLYGVRRHNTYVVIHVTHKQNGNCAKGHLEGVQIVGELFFAQDVDDIHKASALKRQDENGCNYLYVAHYGGRPMLISGQTEEIKNQDALFILYNLSKYIYIISDDHVSRLVWEALRKDGMLEKKTVKKKGAEECHHEKDKQVDRDKIESDDIYRGNSMEKENQETSPCDGSHLKWDIDKDGQTEQTDRLDHLNRSHCSNGHIGNERNERKEQELNMHEIITLLNKRNEYADRIEKGGEENGPRGDQDDTTNLAEQNVFSRNIKSSLSFFKDRLHMHSQWHPLLTSLMRNRHSPPDYAKYKELLLIRLCNFIIDVMLGFFVFMILSHEIINLHVAFQKASVLYDSGTLTSILGTLLQNPLGLKLNNNFTSFIGSIIVSILDKWDYFKNVFSLRSSSAVQILKLSSLCGVSFFLSFFMDYLKLITLHVTLIFNFLKKILSIFHSNMYSLYLLFNGKKWNILKLRVDTNYYTNEEVILGTILFTILIFLYPTVLVLFLVFGIIYVVIRRIIYFLSFLKEIILYTPFYILLLRNSQNGYISKGIRLTVDKPVHNMEWTDFPKSHYLLLENDNFAFFDKMNLFLGIFISRKGEE